MTRKLSRGRFALSLRATSLLLCLAFLLVSMPLMASEYPLESVAFLSEKEVSSLKGLPAATTHEAGKALASAKQRSKAAKKTGLKSKRLNELASLFDLMRIEGVGPRMAQLFHATGLGSTQALSKENAEELAKKLLETNGKKGIANKIPDATILRDWIAQAKALPEQYSP